MRHFARRNVSANIPQVGSRLHLSIDRLSLGGDGVGRSDHCVVFVPYGCPGDTLEVEIIESHARYARARLLRVLTASPQRTTPPCPYHFHAQLSTGAPPPNLPPPATTTMAGVRQQLSGGRGKGQKLFCGGCSWQHIVYDAQLAAKRQLVQETIERLGKVHGIAVKPTLGMKDPWRYRNKVQQPVGWDGQRLISGFYAPNSHQIVPMEDCLVQPELSVAILNRTRTLLEQFHVPPYDEKHHRGWIRHVWIRTAQQQALLVFITRTPDFPHESRIVTALVQEFPALVGIHQNVNPGKTNVILGRHWRKLCGSDFLEERLGGLRFRLSAGSFFQVNTAQAEALYEVVRQFISTQRGTLLDLYCGVGGMALSLADRFQHIIGVDETVSGIVDARQNARLNRILSADFYADRVETFLRRYRRPNFREGPFIVVLDPPRSGCSPQALHGLRRLLPNVVVYVSCDSGTLSRDISLLTQTGFRLEAVQPVDLFPHTPHIETVALLKG